MYSDPSHAWCAVRFSELENLNLIDKISSCSYMNGGTVYLEEDCDFTLFLEAKEKSGEIYKKDWFVKENYKEKSHIRGYRNFSNRI